MTPFKTIFGIDAFNTWTELETDIDEDEPDDLARKLSSLHKTLVNNASLAKLEAALNFDKAIKEIQYEVGGRVISWRSDSSKMEGKKLWKPWIDP